MQRVGRLRLAAGLTLACTVVLALAGCFGLGMVKPPDSETFTTRIAPGGLKFFVYQWGDLDGGDLSGARRSQRSNRPVAEGELPALEYVVDHRAGFIAGLEDKLEETGYCREGYYRLSSHFIPGESRLRGECRELATPEDRAQFPN